MRLLSVLNVLEDEQEICVFDEHAPIDKLLLFEGTAADCKKVGRIRNGVVTTILPDRELNIFIDIEYQKKKSKQGGATR